MFFSRGAAILPLLWLLLSIGVVSSQEVDAPDAAAEKQFQTLADRYWKLLRARPRRDTAFDLWYRHYLDAGKLEDLAQTVQQEAEAKAQDANAQILLGLVLERRGEEEESLTAFNMAEKLAPTNYYPPLMRGVLLARRQSLDEAAEALAKAASLNPPRTEVPDIYKRLGRVRLQQGKTKEALEAFAALSEKFPDDRQVLEELAQLLTEEGQREEAIRRWEQLVALAQDDPHQQLQAQLEIAQLKIALGQRTQGIVLLEQALARAKPESWLERDIRRRVEQAFVQSQDVAGLVSWCEERLKRNAQDLGTLLQLARALEQTGQREAALARYQEAVKLAPSRRDLRESLIDALVALARPAEAIAQCQKLVEQDPHDADALRRFGQLQLMAADRASRPAAERTAAEIWQKIAAIRPADPAFALQTAEACRHGLLPSQLRASQAAPGSKTPEPSPLVVAAEKSYREAIRRAPTEPQYHEYLGEFLHAQGRREEAVAAWAQMAQVPAVSAESYHRLAEVYASFDCTSEAIAAAAKSNELLPDDFALREFHLGLLIKDKQHESALAALTHLDRLATDEALKEKALHRRVEVYVAAERVDRELQALEQIVREGKAGVREHWLVGLLHSQRWQYAQAARAFKTAQDLAADHLPLAQAYAEALKLAGDNDAASEQYQRLAKIDPRYRFTYYQEIIQLHLKRGQTQQAQETADLLVRLSPSNVEAFRIRASVAFRAGDAFAGLRDLRQAVKLSPRDVDLRTQLARALSERNEGREALEHYWRAFELADNLSGKLSLVGTMAVVAQKAGQADEVIEQLRRQRLKQDEPKTLTLCLAEAQVRLKRHQDAQRELVTLLDTRGEDLEVLLQLAQIAEQMRSWDDAVRYQERVVALDPNRKHLETLANLFSAKSDYTSAARIWEQMLLDATDDAAAAAVVDRQLQDGRVREALALAELRLKHTPESWPLLLRSGSASLAIQKSDLAGMFFEKILTLPDEPELRAAPTSPSPGVSAPQVQPVTIPRGVHVIIGASGQRYTITTAGGSQVALPGPVFGAGFPESQEFAAVRSIASRFSALQNYSAQASAAAQPARVRTINGTTTSSRIPRPTLPLSTASTLEQAKLEATYAMHGLSARRNELQQWVASQKELGEQSPRTLRRVALVSVGWGSYRNDDIQELLTQLERARPEDALPHLIRLYPANLRGTPAPLQEHHTVELTRSFEWLSERRPEARGDLVYFYLTQLITHGDTKTTAAVVDRELATAKRFSDLGLMASLVLRSGDITLLRSMLERGATFEVSRDDARIEAPYIKLLLDHALANARLTTEQDANNALAIVERYLVLPNAPPATAGYSPFLTPQAVGTAPVGGMPVARPATGQPAMPVAPARSTSSMPVAAPTRPTTATASPGLPTGATSARQSQEQAAIVAELNNLDASLRLLQARTGTDPSTSSQMQVLTQRRQALINALRTRGYAVSSFPAPNALLDADRVNLLNGLVFWLKQTGQQTLLEERMAQRAKKSQGTEQKTYRLASVYALWWADKKSVAVDELSKLVEAAPEDNLMKLTLAQAHCANEEPRLSLAALEQIASPGPELLAAVEQLRAEIRRRWSDFSLLRDLTGHTHVVRALAFSPDGRQLVSGSYDRSVRIWNARTGRMERLLPGGHKDMILAVAWSPTGDLIASGGYDGVRLWSTGSGRAADTLNGAGLVRALAFSPDGKTLATAGDDGIVRLWNVLLGSEIAALAEHQGPVLGLAFSPDGKLLASASRDRTIRLWDPASRQMVDTLTGHSAAVTCVAFAPDGQRLATGSEDKHVMLWRLPAGKVYATLQQHVDAVQAVAFAPDGNTLASAGADKTIRLWRADASQLPATLLGHNHTVAALAFAPKDAALAKQVLASSGFDEQIKLWAVGPDSGK